MNIVAAASFAVLSGGAHAITYSVDTPPYNPQAYSAGNDVIGYNGFTAVGGADTISTISVLWATGGAPGNVTLAIFDDPNNDNIFTDAVVQQTLLVSYSGVGSGSFVDYAITPTAVSGVFGVAAYVENGAGGLFPVLFSETAGCCSVQFNAASLQDAIRNGQPYLDVGLRAVSVPEPTTLALIAFGIAGLGFGRRKRIAK